MRAFESEKTDVAEVDRSIYDIRDGSNAAFAVSSGLCRTGGLPLPGWI